MFPNVMFYPKLLPITAVLWGSFKSYEYSYLAYCFSSSKLKGWSPLLLVFKTFTPSNNDKLFIYSISLFSNFIVLIIRTFSLPNKLNTLANYSLIILFWNLYLPIENIVSSLSINSFSTPIYFILENDI